MKSMITTLKGRPNLNGELLFDDYKLYLKHDLGSLWMYIIILGILSLSNGISFWHHSEGRDLTTRSLYMFAFSASIFFLFYTIGKFRDAKKMHDKEFKPEDIKTVYIAKTKRNTKIRFVLNDDFEQYFKFKSDVKCEKLISFLKKSEVEIINV